MKFKFCTMLIASAALGISPAAAENSQQRPFGVPIATPGNAPKTTASTASRTRPARAGLARNIPPARQAANADVAQSRAASGQTARPQNIAATSLGTTIAAGERAQQRRRGGNTSVDMSSQSTSTSVELVRARRNPNTGSITNEDQVLNGTR